jgi:hypothetical protein
VSVTTVKSLFGYCCKGSRCAGDVQVRVKQYDTHECRHMPVCGTSCRRLLHRPPHDSDSSVNTSLISSEYRYVCV